jgi:flagellar biosynthesis/type III secretory pathway protein FliH
VGRIVAGLGRVVARPVLDARAEAAALLATAHAEAAEARAGAEAIRDEARRAGRQEGRDEGRAEGLAAGLAEIAAARAVATRRLEDAAPVAAALAAKMAEKIVGRAVALAPEVMAEIAGEAIAACRPRGGDVRVRVHPDDLPAVAARHAALAARAPAARAIELVADEAVGRHGCVIETAHGRVDARLATQLAALERALGETEKTTGG